MLADHGIARRVAIALLGLAVSSFSGACFFTNDINEAPVPGIRVAQSGPFHVGDVLAFDATKTVDDNIIGLQAHWQAQSCLDGRSPRCIAVGEPFTGELDDRFTVEIVSHETLEVQLRVTDSLGATRVQPDIFTVDVSNRDPSMDMQVSGYREGVGGPFVLSRVINLIPVPEFVERGLVDGDGDELSLDWQLLPPPGSNPSLRIFSARGDGQILVPDVEGSWGVIMRASDAFGGSDEVRKDFVVGPDGPPCLQGMDPTPIEDSYYLVDSADGARRFSVLSVLDALDAFPLAVDDDPVLGEARFHWFLQEPGSANFEEIVGYSSASYLVDPSAYQPGDALAIRVEVSDRVSGPARALPCGADSWACELDTASGCFQRQTWGVQIQ